MSFIRIQGARTHNLKGVSVDIPRDKLVVITGLSGSGKSSLAFDTLYAEGQRKYVESLSTYARQFLSMMEKPDVELIEGLSPAISIEQKSTSHNPRSTVGTVTEIYDYLRLLYARVGVPHCPEHGESLTAQTVSQMVDLALNLPAESKQMMLAPLVREKKGEHLHIFQQLKTQGFVRVRVDGLVYDIDEAPPLDKKKKHSIEAVVDRFKVRPDVKQRLAESFETALELGEGLAYIASMDDDNAEPMIFSARFACPQCGYSINELEPRLFSFNNPAGACSACDGLGVQQRFDQENVVQDPELSLSEGAVKGWDRRNVFYFQMLTSLADHYGFDISTPFKKLTKKIQKIVLFGSGKESIEFRYLNDKGAIYQRSHPFEGIIPNLERRFRETDSDAVREELSKFLTVDKCEECDGSRLCEAARHVTVKKMSLPEISGLTVKAAYEYYSKLKLPGKDGKIAEKILREINDRLSFLVNVGLDYLSLDRGADSLSGGEAQRIRLASQIGSGLVGVMYVLDEPSIGLHQRDNDRLLATLTHLRDLGNTVLVVEHDEDTIRSADHVLDIGPGAGVHGGEIIAEGTAAQIAKNKKSLTGDYLSGRKSIPVPEKRIEHKDKWLSLKGANGNNLKEVDLNIPVGLFTCITGVSGSGKSTLINRTLWPLAATHLNRATQLKAAEHKAVEGFEHFDKAVDIDQSPIGRTPRSNPATYTGLFTPIRELFAGTQEARARGYKPGRFSFNVKGGRCEACQGDGVIKVEMHFLADIYVPCDQCKGKRYNRETLEIGYKGKNIHQVLEMTVEEAREFFDAIPALARKLQTLLDVGLGYITLGQSATTLSGGEAQRIKLAKELSKRDTGKTLYILDEPTTGLHFHDIQQLLHVIIELRDRGNTIIIIEHNLDVIKTCDWIVDLGPEGGSGGGEIVVEGIPEAVAKSRKSHTARFLKPLLSK